MAERVIVMNEGVVVQEGAPIDLYTRPRNSFVAQFLGDVNVFNGVVTAVDGDIVQVKVADGALSVLSRSNGALTPSFGDDVRIGIRPSQVRSAQTSASGANHVRGTLERATFLGEIWRYRVNLASGIVPFSLEFLSMDPIREEVGQTVELSVAYHDVVLLPAEISDDLADE